MTWYIPTNPNANRPNVPGAVYPSVPDANNEERYNMSYMHTREVDISEEKRPNIRIKPTSARPDSAYSPQKPTYIIGHYNLKIIKYRCLYCNNISETNVGKCKYCGASGGDMIMEEG